MQKLRLGMVLDVVLMIKDHSEATSVNIFTANQAEITTKT